MDSYEATNIVLSKIKRLDPENASRIMGYILMDLGESDLIRLACSPDQVLYTLVLKVKVHLGLSSSKLSTSASAAFTLSPSPSSTAPLVYPIVARSSSANSSNHSPFSQTSNGDFDTGFEFVKCPSSHSWPLSRLSNNNNPISPKSSPSLSFDNIRSRSLSLSSYENEFYSGGASSDLVDEHQLSDSHYFSFLNERSEDLVDPRLELHNWNSNADTHFHRRSYSASDVCVGSEDEDFGIGYKPCLYFARGYCKNGSNCKFVHGGFGETLDASSSSIVGSPSGFDSLEQREDIMRLKAIQQQRLAVASRFMSGMSPSSYEKYINFLTQQHNDPQRAAAAAALMMGEEFYKLGRYGSEKNDLLEKSNSASRQIYLTFPAESTFKDEDVAEYFSKFGLVHDVRIPYQQKRMFGFVTFMFPDTVRIILAKGNPHFICDSRVLVKPYKEKGKIPEKRQQFQHLERGDLSPCLSPSVFDASELHDLPLGPRMLYNRQELMLRRKLEEQAEFKQAMGLQERRLMNLQLPDINDNRLQSHQRSLSVGAPVLLPQQLRTHISCNPGLLSVRIDEGIRECDDKPATTFSLIIAAAEHKSELQVNQACILNNGIRNKGSSSTEEFDLPTSVELLPDKLFASPTKAASDHVSEFSSVAETNESTKLVPSISSDTISLPTCLSAGEMASA